MFWRKKEKQSQNNHEDLPIQVIPDVFYGAHDPAVAYGNGKKKSLPKNYNNNSVSFWDNLKHKKIFLWSLVTLIFMIALAVITFYYLHQAGVVNLTGLFTFSQTEDESAPVYTLPIVDVPVESNVPEENLIEEEIISTSTPVADVTPVVEVITKELPEPEVVIRLDFPKLILASSPDVDSDELSDLEEEMFDTDSGKWDTDDDGYYDGQEVVNLYNPRGVAPVRLIDSGLVSEYVNPEWRYRLFYPQAWAIGEVDVQSRQVLFSTISGDYIEALVFELEVGDSFSAWFGKEAVGQQFSDLSNEKNVFAENFYKRKDGLVVYFNKADKVYVLLYHPGPSGQAPYKHIMDMMAQSFRPTKNNIEIPDQAILPQP